MLRLELTHMEMDSLTRRKLIKIDNQGYIRNTGYGDKKLGMPHKKQRRLDEKDSYSSGLKDKIGKE
jgi:hypothetical protein